jgi:hypothetical protein
MFNIGDKVKINDLNGKYLIPIVEQMYQYINKTVTVSARWENPLYYTFLEIPWCWPEECLELIEKGHTFYEGEIVEVKTRNPKLNYKYLFSSGMEDFSGLRFTISRIEGDKIYLTDLDYIWDANMLEPVYFSENQDPTLIV